ncbi:MAG: serine/threonine protein kinase [Kiritimatiellae bacterium]|nr:serine/threonine protein kinase [Kiritimatiellia bacterium]
MSERTDSYATPPSGAIPPRPTKDTVLEPGKVLGKYEILEFLAEGGMGLVYRGRHRILLSQHAIKVVRQTYAGQDEFVSRFRREARIMAALEHPNIVRVTDFGEDEGLYYYVMDYVAGPDGPPRTLDDEIRALTAAGKGGIPERRVREVVLQICDALAYAHGYGQEGVAHLDLKPSNIMLIGQTAARDVKMPVKVTDFGFAKILGRDSLLKSIAQSQSSVDGDKSMITGTPRYMSPEQWKGEQEAGPASDIYSMGVIIYEALVGKVPQEVYPAKPPSAFGCSDDWDRVVERCLRNDPLKRYPTADKLARDIRRVQFIKPRTRKRRKWPKVVGALATLAVLAGLGALLLRLGVIKDEQVAQGRKIVEQAYAKGRRKMQVLLKPPGYINIRSDPGVDILILSDHGEQVRPGPTDSFGRKTGIRLPEGVYSVVLKHKSFFPVTNRIAVIPGEIVTLERSFPTPESDEVTHVPVLGADTRPARVKITCNVPAAVIYKGSEALGRAGEVLSLAPFVSHDLEVRAPGHKTAKLALTLAKPGQREDDRHVELVEWGPVVNISATFPPGRRPSSEAEILVDGKSIGVYALPLTWEGLSPGMHTVAIAAGPWKATPPQEVEVVQGVPADVHFVLELLDSFLAFDVTPPDASIYVNGRKQSSTVVEVAADVTHEVRIWAKDHEPYTDRLKVALGQTNRVTVVLESKEQKRFLRR